MITHRDSKMTTPSGTDDTVPLLLWYVTTRSCRPNCPDIAVKDSLSVRDHAELLIFTFADERIRCRVSPCFVRVGRYPSLTAPPQRWILRIARTSAHDRGVHVGEHLSPSLVRFTAPLTHGQNFMLVALVQELAAWTFGLAICHVTSSMQWTAR